jgi:hypothetical protein
VIAALTIHTAVKYSGKLVHNLKSQRLRGVIPTVVGLSIVPALPYLVSVLQKPFVGSCFGSSTSRSSIASIKALVRFPLKLIVSSLTVEKGYIERKLGLPVNEEPVKSSTLPPELQVKKDL